jgi:hypothetical protein
MIQIIRSLGTINIKEKKMANYLLLYTGGDTPRNEAERQSITGNWMTWYSKLGSAVIDQGNPFTPVAKSISSEGRILDGPIGMQASGYSIIKAKSLDEAARLAKDCPILKHGGKISVYEITSAMG